jgi:hypothetical protein
MPKKVIIITAIGIFATILIGSFFLLQNFNKSKAINISISASSSSVTISQNPEVKNPFIKNNQSEDYISENSSSKPKVTISEKIVSSNSSITKNEKTFIEKKLLDNSKIYNLDGFDPKKLQGEVLIELNSYYPNNQNQLHLFIEKNGVKKFIGYGAVDSFQFEVKNKKYNLTVFEDETGYPSLVLTNENYTDPKKVYAGFEYTTGRFTQKSGSDKFVFDGGYYIGEGEEVINKTFDIQDIYDFDPKD